MQVKELGGHPDSLENPNTPFHIGHKYRKNTKANVTPTIHKTKAADFIISNITDQHDMLCLYFLY